MKSEVDIQNARHNLRRTTLASRDSLSALEHAIKSRQACELLLGMPEFCKAVNLFIYVGYRSEVKTIELIEKCIISKPYNISVPLTIPNEGLEAYRISDLSADLSPGFCSIPEPVTTVTEKIDPAEIDIVVLPGSVFDKKGNRLGYGGGYYDRFLANNAPQALRVGLAFELQVVDHVPVMGHDKPLDYLVTEEKIMKFSL